MRASIATLLLALAPALAAARTLYWSALDVEASLDADGRLHVVERQTMVFTGDWNGGERAFRVFAGQELELRGVRRVDPPTGKTIELRQGSLGSVDQYDWHSKTTLRWRSRDPGDPPFDGTAIRYDLDYTLSGAVSRVGERYRLDHDFAFPDRVGPIERFSLDLEIDPAWQVDAVPGAERRASPTGSRFVLERTGLPPGESVVVTFELERAAAEAPAAVRRQLSPQVRSWIAGGAAAAMLLLFGRFLAFEVRRGRFAPADVPDALDHGWLEEHLLDLRAEEAGALWDQSIGAPEVSAVLARLVAERKLRSSVREVEGRFFKRRVLELELAVERDEFHGYERRLIDKLFFSGRDKTDTDAVKERYKSTGFSPVATIQSGLTRRLAKVPGFGGKPDKPAKSPTALLVLAAVVCLAIEGVTRGQDALGPALGMIIVTTIGPVLLGWIFAVIYRRRADRLFWFIPFFVLPIAAGAAILLTAIRAGAGFPLPGLGDVGLYGVLGMALVPIAFFNSILNTARTRDGVEAVATRRRLAAVRRHFRRELARSRPALEDAWLPYLLAFGLHRPMDRWARSYGGGHDFHRSAVGSGGDTTGGWTGGGGAFGGAGATAGWAAAAGTMAAGVAAPGSGGSGGGGGGGGSSGGGGGGGW